MNNKLDFFLNQHENEEEREEEIVNELIMDLGDSSQQLAFCYTQAIESIEKAPLQYLKRVLYGIMQYHVVRDGFLILSIQTGEPGHKERKKIIENAFRKWQRTTVKRASRTCYMYIIPHNPDGPIEFNTKNRKK